MRSFLLVAAALISAGAAAATPNRACAVCHTAPLFDGEAFSRSVHARLDCADCHKGYDFSIHRARPPPWSPQEAALIAAIGARSTAPEAIAACGRCHAAARDDLAGSVHGRWLSEPRKASGPLCLDCHGNPHSIDKGLAAQARKKAFAARCAACHEDAGLIARAGLSPHPVGSFRDSVHGRLVELGSDRAPVCFNCHGSHDIAPAAAPASMVSPANKAATCAECHPGASQNFAATFTHAPMSRVSRPIPHYTAVLFSWLTSLVLSGLVVHVSVDFASGIRRWSRRRRQRAGGPAAPSRSVVRFDRHQLIQHWILIVSVLTLVVTEWPLRGAPVPASHALVAALGGVKTASLVHRIAGVTMGVAALYHLVYLTILALRRKMAFSMLPTPRDVRDLVQNVAWFLGIRKEPPRFGRFMYAEKFDYWAVFWGVAIMFGTGLVRWFPVWFAKLVPASVIEACQIAHGDEATLAALALFVWHLYNVHLRPGVFPMSWVWIDGRIGVETLKEEHPLEYEQLEAAGRLPGDER